MIYILIVLWSSATGKAAISVEFNSMDACQAASRDLRQQQGESFSKIVAITCVAKGAKQ